jgi:hypothetical protein
MQERWKKQLFPAVSRSHRFESRDRRCRIVLPPTDWQTARKSAPASTSGLALSGVIPPIATQGISNKVDHQVRIDGSGRYSDGFVIVG